MLGVFSKQMLKSDLEKWLLTVALNCLISFRCHLAAHLLQKSSLKKWGPGSSGWSTVIRVNSFNVPNPKSLVSEVVYTPKKTNKCPAPETLGLEDEFPFLGRPKCQVLRLICQFQGMVFVKETCHFSLAPWQPWAKGSRVQISHDDHEFSFSIPSFPTIYSSAWWQLDLEPKKSTYIPQAFWESQPAQILGTTFQQHSNNIQPIQQHPTHPATSNSSSNIQPKLSHLLNLRHSKYHKSPGSHQTTEAYIWDAFQEKDPKDPPPSHGEAPKERVEP